MTKKTLSETVIVKSVKDLRPGDVLMDAWDAPYSRVVVVGWQSSTAYEVITEQLIFDTFTTWVGQKKSYSGVHASRTFKVVLYTESTTEEEDEKVTSNSEKFSSLRGLLADSTEAHIEADQVALDLMESYKIPSSELTKYAKLVSQAAVAKAAYDQKLADTFGGK